MFKKNNELNVFSSLTRVVSPVVQIKTVKRIRKVTIFFSSRKNSIDIAHCKHVIIIARTYPTQARIIYVRVSQ